MYPTKQVLAALREANPDRPTTEEHIRRALRRGDVPPPTTVAGRFLWTAAEAEALAAALDLIAPELVEEAAQ